MMQKSNLIALIFGLITPLFIWFADPEFAFNLSLEDGVIETLSALFYFVALVVSVITVIKDKRFLLAYVWIVLSFVFLGEETSWFQRIFNYSVSSVEELNAQSEFNFHNLEIFQGGGLSNGFEWQDLFKSQNLFRLGFFGYFLFLPLLTFIPKVQSFLAKFRYKKTDYKFVLVIIIVFTLSFTFTYYAENSIKRPLAESREMLYAFFIMTYVIAYVWNERQVNKQ